MGNYHEVLMKREELRDIDEEKKPRTIMFGNPFRSEKVYLHCKHKTLTFQSIKNLGFAVAIDEAEDEGQAASAKTVKRKTPSSPPPPQ
jgi:hypothetical protein